MDLSLARTILAKQMPKPRETAAFFDRERERRWLFCKAKPYKSIHTQPDRQISAAVINYWDLLW